MTPQPAYETANVLAVRNRVELPGAGREAEPRPDPCGAPGRALRFAESLIYRPLTTHVVGPGAQGTRQQPSSGIRPRCCPGGPRTMRQTDQMLARYTAEIEDRQNFIDGLVEDAEKGQRDLSDQEMELITRARDRLQSLTAQITPLKEARRISSESANEVAELHRLFSEHKNDKPARGRLPLRRRVRPGLLEGRPRRRTTPRSACSCSTAPPRTRRPATTRACCRRRWSSRSSTTSTPPGRSPPPSASGSFRAGRSAGRRSASTRTSPRRSGRRPSSSAAR